MRVVVHVAEEHLRGVPFKRYAAVLGNIIGEGFNPDEHDVLPSAKTTVSIDGRKKGEDVAEIRAMAREITLPDRMDGYFENGEWKRLYGDKEVNHTTPE